MTFKVRQLQLDITQQCNFQCDGCMHYSNFGMKDSVPLATGLEWTKAWANRVMPETFTLLGGEPSLHPDLTAYVDGTRQTFPDSKIRLFSNGYFLHRHAHLADALARTQTQLVITVHFSDTPYQDKIIKILADWSEYSEAFGFPFLIVDARRSWYKPYRGTGRDMLPFTDGNPRQSWKVCMSKYCMQLYEGRLWKCPDLAYLGGVAQKFGLGDKPEWQPYLKYEGIGLDATDEELIAFLRLEDEPFCGMCPSNIENMPSHGLSPEAIRGHLKDESPSRQVMKPAPAPLIPRLRARVRSIFTRKGVLIE